MASFKKKKGEILIRPLVTEKSTLSEVNGKYIFRVSDFANKVEIKKAVKEIYNIQPVKVNIIWTKSKPLRYGRVAGRTKPWKKAIVTFKKGEKIDLSKKE